MSVARLSVVDMQSRAVLDVIIKPSEKVLDCNTRFSGLTMPQLENAEHNRESAIQLFFELVNANSILVGHSLENDLRVLRLVHKRVVDTSVVFPHRLGPPMKRALRNLASEILYDSLLVERQFSCRLRFRQKIIQENDENQGHDSTEDSQTCMQLIMLLTTQSASAWHARK